MTTIINFLQHHNEKQEREIQKLFQKANSLDDKLDVNIGVKILNNNGLKFPTYHG